jgi:hypothetical protein
MVSVKLEIRRSNDLWGGVTPETVKRYLGELEAEKEKLREILLDMWILNKGMMDALNIAIDKEISLCHFYEEFLKRSTEPNFNTWVFTKQADALTASDLAWNENPGDKWTKTNGRVKATIQFDNTGLMTKLTLSYENNSQCLSFYETGRGHEQTAHLKSETSIQAKVNEMKLIADTFLADHLYPLYTRNDEKVLSQLLFIEG